MDENVLKIALRKKLKELINEEPTDFKMPRPEDLDIICRLVKEAIWEDFFRDREGRFRLFGICTISHYVKEGIMRNPSTGERFQAITGRARVSLSSKTKEQIKRKHNDDKDLEYLSQGDDG